MGTNSCGLFFAVLLLPMLSSRLAAAVPPSMTKSSCPKSHWQCGNVSIPYPFGIGKDCYKNKSFEIECRKSLPILSSLQVEVINISANDGALVKLPPISFGCQGRKDGGFINFTGTPFLVGIFNVFMAVGDCNTRALLTGVGPEFVGCESSCGNNQTATAEDEDGYCAAATLPQRIPFLNVSFESKITDDQTQNRSEGCTVAFLALENWISSSHPINIHTVKDLKYVPVLLNVALDGDPNNPTLSCDDYTNRNQLAVALRCFCAAGYDGNPHLGCQDIDECEDPTQHSCGAFSKCVNQIGSYTCKPHAVRLAILVTSLVGGVLTLLFGIWLLYKRIQRRKSILLKKKLFKRNGGLLLQQQLRSIGGGNRKIRIFNTEELEKATDGFHMNRILGQGGQGTVYKGMLEDGSVVAIKKSKIIDENRVGEFINEVVILSQINHRNVVRLLGCCLETEVPLLVYEFIPNGTLSHHLHHQNEQEQEQKQRLSWEMRIQIAAEAAGALAYLHSAASIPIYHRDIKSTNILLDKRYRAKVADFGTSRSMEIDQTHLTTRVQGTLGYLDPEYFQSGQFTEKSDVYSFGVVLVELLSGKQPVFFSESSCDTQTLATHFLISWKRTECLTFLMIKLVWSIAGMKLLLYRI